MSDALRVLVVEDDSIAAMIAARFLAHLGCETEAAATVEDAVGILTRSEIELVLSDVILDASADSGMATTYLDACRSGGWDRDPVLYAVSGDALGADPEAYTRIGFDGYLPKPIDFDRLRQIVESVAEQRDVGS